MSSEVTIINGIKFVDGIAYGTAVDLVRGPDGVLERVRRDTLLGDVAQQVEEERLAFLAKQEQGRARQEAARIRRQERAAECKAKAAVRA